jgi:hypothetical protein
MSFLRESAEHCREKEVVTFVRAERNEDLGRVTLNEAERLIVHIVADAPEIDADLAAILFVALKQLVHRTCPVVRKVYPVGYRLPWFSLDDEIRLEGLDKAMKHCLGRNRLLVTVAVSCRDTFEEWDDEVESPAPERGIHLKNALQALSVARFDEKGKTERS